MKRLLIAFAAVLIIAPAALTAQTTITKTWFEGEHITGVSAEDFDVELIKSDRTRAVVELGERGLERFLRIGLDSLGVVSISLNNFKTLPELREIERLSKGNPLIRVTVYLPTVNTIRIQGRIELSTSDSFSGENLDIMLANYAVMSGSVRISSERAKIQASGSSMVENLILDQTTSLTLFAVSLAQVNVVATRADYSKLNVWSASVRIGGAGEWGSWELSGNSRLDAEEFVARSLDIDANGSASAVVNVSGGLKARTTGKASVRYRGTPRIEHNSYSKASSIKPL